MKIATKILSMIAVAATLSLSACGEDDVEIPAVDGDISAQNDPNLMADDLQGNITGDITLDATTNWMLTGPLSVKEGGVLRIQPGTIIKAEPGSTNVYIVVETGGKIFANGTANAPIKITSSASNPQVGDWGGLLVNGLAPISGGGTSTTEVLPLSYGGNNPNDNSGEITYLILEHTGARINGEKEFNGLTLYGVGDGTVVNNIVINGGDDDAVEWFGGTVNVSNILVINARDDMFDWTQGYTGTITNAYGIRKAGFIEVSEDPRGIEADGNLDGDNPNQTGQSDVTVNGLTIINAEPNVKMADLIKIRRGSAATITNAYVKDAGEVTDFVDLSDGKGDATSGSITVVGDGTADITKVKQGTSTITINANIGTTGGTAASNFNWAAVL